MRHEPAERILQLACAMQGSRMGLSLSDIEKQFGVGRRKAQRLKPGQIRLLRRAHAAVMRLSDDRGYGRWAGVHGLPLPMGCSNAHGTPLFLPWHRAYLYRFERALRDQVPDAMVCWWDWRTPPDRPGRLPGAYAEEVVDVEPG